MKRIISFICIVLIFSILLSIPVAASLEGDINGDDDITTEDARIALRMASGIVKYTYEEKQRADMNKDGYITTEDVRLVLVAAAGIDTDKGYMTRLMEKGFPKSYVEDLLTLHRLYPEWDFKPFKTGLEWEDAVKGEHTPHNKQLITKNEKASFKCNCSSCRGVIQEAGGWVSASETAVRYYLDPRNFLDESHIFQFESTLYDKGQTIAGIEAILKPTWMYNSSISYVDALGNNRYVTSGGKRIKYSEVIMRAAEESGMSAYYLAAKMVQEVGSSTPSYAGGSSGTNAPYNGIYNYYNIGAYTGAGDGLRWANGYMKAGSNAPVYEKADMNSKVLVKVPSNTELNYISENSAFYRVKVKVNSKWYQGYVPKHNAYLNTSYGRPWTNPYATIMNGAKYIYDSFAKYQYTSFLQKFNVNKESGSLYNHEYMANIQAAASESTHTYRAYRDNGLLNNRKVFYIPVFNNMPNGNLSKAELFAQTKVELSCRSTTSASVTLQWEPVLHAEGYEIFKYNASTKKFEKIGSTKDIEYTDSNVKNSAKYKVIAYRLDGKKKYYSSYSDVFEAITSPKAPTGLSLASVTETAVNIKWNSTGADKYLIYRYDPISNKYSRVGTVTSTSFHDKDLMPGIDYTYKIKAQVTRGSMTAYSSYSATLKVTTKGTPVKLVGTVKVTDWLNVRTEPNTKSEVVAQLSDGTQVFILEAKGDWYKIGFTENGKRVEGFAHKDFLEVKDLTIESCPYKEPTSTLKSGSSGEGVKWLQWYLYKLDYLKKVDIDGDFGPTTLKAVKKFQTDYKLDVDGLAGSGTRAALKKAYGK